MNYLADTNVLSEPRRKSPDLNVVRWLRENESRLYTSVLVIGELRYGINRLATGSRKEDLQAWLERLVEIMEGRILSINLRVADEWARMHQEISGKGKVLPTVDMLLAATARRYDLAIATNNVRDFENSGVRVVNPFEL